jgi:hypothetical protein
VSDPSANACAIRVLSVLTAPIKLLNLHLTIALVLLAVISFGVLAVQAPSGVFTEPLDGPTPWEDLHDTIMQLDWTEAVLLEQAITAYHQLWDSMPGAPPNNRY